jgi:hypothetical protein
MHSTTAPSEGIVHRHRRRGGCGGDLAGAVGQLQHPRLPQGRGEAPQAAGDPCARRGAVGPSARRERPSHQRAIFWHPLSACASSKSLPCTDPLVLLRSHDCALPGVAAARTPPTLPPCHGSAASGIHRARPCETLCAPHARARAVCMRAACNGESGRAGKRPRARRA